MFVRRGWLQPWPRWWQTVELRALAVLVEGHEPLAKPAADPAGQEIGATGPAPDPAPVGGCEQLGGDDSLVVSGEPLAIHLDLAQIDARSENAQNSRILDTRSLGDLALACPLAPHGENASDDGCHLVGHELPVDEVVTSLGSIDPLALTHGLLHAHAHVLGQLLAVELREGTEDVVEHPPRRRRQVDLLGERVQCDVGLPETVGQHDEIAEVAGQPVEPPGDDVGDVALVDHVQQLLQPGPLEVLARESRVSDDRHRAEVVQLGVDAQLVSLPGDREALRRLFLRRHPAVGHRQHRCPPVPPCLRALCLR